MPSQTRYHIIRPKRLVYAAPSLVYAELFAGMVGLVIADGNFLGAALVILFSHPVSVWLTIQEPHIDTVVREVLRRNLGVLGLSAPQYPPASTSSAWRKGRGVNSYVP